MPTSFSSGYPLESSSSETFVTRFKLQLKFIFMMGDLHFSSVLVDFPGGIIAARPAVSEQKTTEDRACLFNFRDASLK